MDHCIQDSRRMAVVANAIAVALTENLSASEQNVLGNLIAQIGSTILSIAAAEEYCESLKTDAPDHQSGMK